MIQNEVLMHEASVDTLKSAAKRIIAADPNSTISTQPMIDKLNSNWHILVDKLEDVWVQVIIFFGNFYDCCLNLNNSVRQFVKFF